MMMRRGLIRLTSPRVALRRPPGGSNERERGTEQDKVSAHGRFDGEIVGVHGDSGRSVSVTPRGAPEGGR